GLWQRLTNAGARPGGTEVYNILRVEAGTPRYGVDIDEERLVMEVGRTAQAISYTKGCYLGQEPVGMARDPGHVNRTPLRLKVRQAGVVPHGSRLFRDGKEVGLVTSSVLSPLVGGVIALAYVRRGSQEVGTVVEIETAAGRCTAEVASLPFLGPSAGSS